jgi:hypothetical protein
MARPSPITIGLTALLGVVLSLAFWLIARPRHPAPPPAAAEPAPEPVQRPRPAPPPPIAAPRPTPPAIRRTPARLPAPAPVAAAETPPPAPASPETTDTGAPPARMPSAMRRDVLVRNHNLRLSEADEQIFGALNLPEATRARIREINDQHRKRTEQGASGTEPPATRTSSVALTAAEERQVALRQLMGADGAQQFNNEERDAIRKIRGKYRFEWGRQLRQ